MSLRKFFSSRIVILSIYLLLFVFPAASQQNLPQLGKAPIKQVIAAMTLEEKAKLVVGNGFNMPGAGGPTVGQTQDKVPGAAGTTFAIPRLGIPSIVVSDGPAGVRISPIRNNDSSKTYYATAFPIGTLLASSWDTALVRKVGAAMGNEVREYGIDILLGPALNIHRNPLGGRNFEYYSEDPLIAGLMTASMVNGIESNGVGTSIKHFVANNQETNRNTINTIVSQRALREIYLKGFKIAVKNSQPWTVMSSYNLVNGTYTSQEYQLLTTILREEWGFKGFVMSDWFGGNDPVAQMKAGNDLLMPGTPEQTRRIISAVEHDSLDIKYLNQNVEHILNIIVQTPAFKHYKYSDKPDLRAHANVSRMAAAEGMVLLKNEGKTLPFTGPKPVALFGNASYDIVAGGTGSGDVNKAYVISLDKGLANAGFGLNLSLNDSYSNYIKKSKAARPKPRNFFETPPAIPEMDITDEVILQNVGNRDAAIITIGRNAGEFNDRKLENDFYLSSAEKQLIEKVSKAFHHAGKKVIVVLNIGGVIEMASWRDEVDAILLAWQPGLEGGNAITDVLTGKINPSGKLPTSFPMDYKDVPSANNFPGREFSEKATTGNFGMKMVPAEVTYEEGIYIGYRYYNTFKVPTAYEFGYGLSYTNFSYSNFKLNSTSMKGKIMATVTITNTGSVAGKEVVQVYRTAPAKYVDKPSIELIAFAKTGLLQPGKSQNLSFTITERDLASFDPQASGFITEAGQYKLSIGSSSNNIKQTATFNVPKLIIVEKDYDVLKPFEEIKELKSKQF